MLYFLGQDRSYLNESAKPDGLFRVVIVGDSMVFGQGCLPTESLPFQLEGVLNAALWDRQVEVVNGGVCGYSIHDAWGRYRVKFEQHQPDLVVLAVCDNDAELYHHREATSDRVRRQTYVEFSESCYDPAGEHFPYFRERLHEIGTFVRQGGPPVVLAFYDIHGGEHRDLLMPRVRDACAAAGVPFADLSQDFVGTAAATHNRELKVSAADHHPSPVAHGIAARRLARVLLAEGLLPRPVEMPEPEPALVRECFARADEMSRGAANPGCAFFFLQRLLAAKRDSRARLRLPAGSRIDDAGYEQATAALERIWYEFSCLTVWESYRVGFPPDLEQFGFGLSLFDMTLCRLAKLLFVVARRLDDPSLPAVEQFEGPADGPPAALPDEVRDKLEGWQRKHREAREFARRTLTQPQTRSDLLPRSAARLAARRDEIARQIEPLWGDVDLVLDAAERALYDCRSLVERVARSGRTDLRDPLGRACEFLAEAVGRLDFFLTPVRHDNLRLLARQIENAAPTAVTTLQVTITAPDCRHPFTDGEPPSLEVWVQSTAPFRRVTADIQTIVRDGVPRVYRFALPFFVSGELRLGLEQCRGLRLGTVRLSNAADKVITLEPGEFTVECDGRVYRAQVPAPALIAAGRSRENRLIGATEGLVT